MISGKDSTEAHLFFSTLIAFRPNHRAGGIACDPHDVSNYKLLYLPGHRNEHTKRLHIQHIVALSSSLLHCGFDTDGDLFHENAGVLQEQVVQMRMTSKHY